MKPRHYAAPIASTLIIVQAIGLLITNLQYGGPLRVAVALTGTVVAAGWLKQSMNRVNNA